MKHATLMLAALGALLLFIRDASASSITTYYDPGMSSAAFNAAVGPVTVEDFGSSEAFPISTGVLNSSTNLVTAYGGPITPGQILPGVTYSFPITNPNELQFNIDAGGGYTGGFLDGLGPTIYSDLASNAVLTATFTGLVTAFGFYTNDLDGIDQVLTINFTSGSSFVDSSITAGFNGFQSNAQDIQSITLGYAPGAATVYTFDLDNFTYTAPATLATAVPEPATLTLLGIGVISMACHLWRRRKQPVSV